MHAKKCLVIAILYGAIAQCAAANDCGGQAHSAMEQAYCEVKAAGYGAALPSLHEFKRNPEKTQRLLLLRPAQRAGVTLPQETKPKANTSKPKATSKPTAPHGPAKRAPEKVAKPAGSVLSCRVQEDWVLCGEQRYQLLGNRANRYLAAGALTAATRLQLAPFAGSVNDSEAVLRYLDESYHSYIEAMIAIGLAGSTLSFTKFYHTFMEVQPAGADFAKRMATMFEYLKEDKKTIAVQAHFSEQRPQNVDQCRQVNQETIICDDVKNNWVFRLQDPAE